MYKHELKKKTETVMTETKAALQTVYDALNQGQRKKILKDEAVAELFRWYNVEVDIDV